MNKGLMVAITIAVIAIVVVAYVALNNAVLSWG